MADKLMHELDHLHVILTFTCIQIGSFVWLQLACLVVPSKRFLHSFIKNVETPYGKFSICLSNYLLS